MNVDVEHRQHLEDPTQGSERNPQLPTMEAILGFIKPELIAPNITFETEWADPMTVATTDLSSVKNRVGRIARAIEDGKAHDDEYSAIPTIAVSSEDDGQDTTPTAYPAINQMMENLLNKEWLINPNYGPEDIQRNSSGRIIKTVQCRTIELAPIRSRDGQSEYRWMLKEQTLPKNDQPNQLVLKRVKGPLAPAAAAKGSAR